MKEMNTNKIRSWCTVDAEDGKIVGIFSTREEARANKKYAAKHGWKQRVAKLKFDSFQR
jgi:hypothetical protein